MSRISEVLRLADAVSVLPIGAIPAWAVNRLGQALAKMALIASMNTTPNPRIIGYDEPAFVVRVSTISTPIFLLSLHGTGGPPALEKLTAPGLQCPEPAFYAA